MALSGKSVSLRFGVVGSPQGLLRRGSHRSGRAELPHPAPQVKLSLGDGRHPVTHPASYRSARCASSSCFVEMVCGLSVPAICPSSSTLTRSSPSLHRLRLGSVRLLPQYYEKTPTSLASSAHLAVPRTADRVLRFAPIDATRYLVGQGVYGTLPQRYSSAESERPPRFLDNPRVNHAVLLDSAE